MFYHFLSFYAFTEMSMSVKEQSNVNIHTVQCDESVESKSESETVKLRSPKTCIKFRSYKIFQQKLRPAKGYQLR